MGRLKKANLVLFVEEPSDNPNILDADHTYLQGFLTRMLRLMHLRSGLEYNSIDLLIGSSIEGIPEIRSMGEHPRFYPSNGYQRKPITREWIENTVMLCEGMITTEANTREFRRFIHGLNTLFIALMEWRYGQDRLHHFVRALEALILPDISKTEKQFVHRCQTFAQANVETRFCLTEAYKMRSAAEHMHDWANEVQSYPADQREKICWQRTRQIEQLACATYSRLLRDATLRVYFKTDDTIRTFWGLQDHERRAIWGEGLDITQEPFDP